MCVCVCFGLEFSLFFYLFIYLFIYYKIIIWILKIRSLAHIDSEVLRYKHLIKYNIATI